MTEDRTIRIDYPPDHIYVVEFTTGTIKVGFTCSPKRRIAQHRTECRRFGSDVAQSWISKPHSGGRKNEARLIAWCTKAGQADGGLEYFRDVAFDDAVRFAKRLPFAAPQSPDFVEHKPMSRFLGGVPRKALGDGMEIAYSVSYRFWTSLLDEIGDRPVSPKRLRELVDNVHVTLFESIGDPAAWAEDAS